MDINALNTLLSGDSFEENIKTLTNKAKELEPLIQAQGGIARINQLESAARSKAGLAESALVAAKDEAATILDNAMTKAEETLSTARERAERVTVLADLKLKAAKDRELELKLLGVSLNKEQGQLISRESDLSKRRAKLNQQAAEIARKEAIAKEFTA